MNEFIVDKVYKMIQKTPDRNIWTVLKNNVEILHPEKFYKFYPINTYSLDCLFRNYFYLSNPGLFNDPFDCNVNLLDGIGSTESMTTVKRNNYSNAGISCLTETIDNHLMWAHYTNNYNGFVLEFEGMNVDIDKNDYKHFALAPVIYPEKPPKVKMEQPYTHQYLFTTKLKHWEYENEWRIVTQTHSGNREMPFTANNVKGIYIGHKIPDENKGLYKMLLEIQELKYPNASIYVVYPHPNDLRLNFEKVWN